jgi:ComF family protein
MLDVDGLLDWLVPRRCALCGEPGAGDCVCPGCRADLPWLSNRCARCGAQLPPGFAGRECGRCGGAGRVSSRIFSAFAYVYPMDRLVTGAKFRRRLQCARVLGELLAAALAGALQRGTVDYPELLIPVPLHPRRLGERGFNQALEIARPVAKRLRVSVRAELCARVRPTAEQTGLAAAERRRNVRRAFVASTAVAGARVAVVDDVITTGSTAAAVAQALREAGAAHIQVWTAARALRR